MNKIQTRSPRLPAYLAAVVAAVCISLSANAQQAELLPLPQSLEVIQGESFEISYLVHPAGQPLAVADMHLHFDPAYLEVISVEVGASNFNVMTPAFDNAMGTIDVSAFQLGDESPQAGFELVKVTFLALNEVALTEAHHPANIFPRTILAFAGQELDAYAAPLEVTIHASDALSAEQSAALGLSLDLWPNPSNGLSYAAFSTDTGGEVTLTLYDLSGKVIAHHFHGNLAAGVEQRVELDIAALQAGVYLCKLNTRHGTVVRRLALTR